MNVEPWWATILLVGPRHTEYASTQGTISDTITTHATDSK